MSKQGWSLEGVSRLARIMLAATFVVPACAAWADSSECDSAWGASSGIHMRRVSYLGPFDSISTDLRADVGEAGHTVRLTGWLYFQEDRPIKNERVLIYNHGHNQERREPCAMAKYFVGKGFVFFAPLRRGHFGPDISSTGVFTDDYVSYCRAADCLDPRCHAPSCSSNELEVSYIRDQREDVREQLDYILAHAAIAKDGSSTKGKLANPHQVAILGHSYGGSLTVFANARLDKQNVAIVVSGAELTWGEELPYWESYLSGSMENQLRPVYFLQPKNGRTLAPTRTLFGIALDQKYRSQAAIFPPVDTDPLDSDPEYQQAHEGFIGQREQVELWGPSVVEFIKRFPRP